MEDSMINLQTLIQMIEEANPGGPEIKEIATNLKWQRPRKPIKVNGFNVSIQASEYHYSSPKESYFPITDYYKVEVGVWREGFNEGNLLAPCNFDPFKMLSNNENTVFPYITWDEVLEIVNLLESLVWEPAAETFVLKQGLHLELQSGTVETQG